MKSRTWEKQNPQWYAAYYLKNKVKLTQRRKAYYDEGMKIILIAKNKPCQDCNGTFPPVCMDFDHVRGEKKFGLSKGFSKEQWEVLVELSKCEVVCSNCHRIRTQARKGDLSASRGS